MLSCVARASIDKLYLYAEGTAEVKEELKVDGENPDSELGLGWNKHSLRVLVDDGKLKIGVKGSHDLGGWFSADEFRLYYNGSADDSDIISALKSKLNALLLQVSDYFNTEELPSFLLDQYDEVFYKAYGVWDDTFASKEELESVYSELYDLYIFATEEAYYYSELESSINEMYEL